MSRASIFRYGLALVAAALTAWGLIGTFGPRSGFTDALFDPRFTIPYVPAGSPLDQAGFQPGDSVIAVEGIPVTDLGMYSRWPRSLSRQPGEVLTLTVLRDGEAVQGQVTFRETPPGTRRGQAIALVIGLAFLWAGVWVFLTAGTTPAAILLGVGLAFGMALPGPDIGTWNGVRDHIQVAGFALGALLLLRFFLTFPEPKPITTRRGFDALLVAPWVGLVGCLAVELAFHPRFYHSFGGYAALVTLGYLLLALAALAHSVLRRTTGIRGSPLAPITVAVALALIPNILAVASWLVPPGFVIPGDRYFLLLFAAVPVGLALGVLRQAHQTAEARSRAPAR